VAVATDQKILGHPDCWLTERGSGTIHGAGGVPGSAPRSGGALKEQREVEAAREPGDVEVGIDEVGELLEGVIKGRRHDTGVGVQHLVALEQTVGVDAQQVAVGIAETVAEDRLNGSGNRRFAVVDLVAVERPAV
jgi:hypothetical protein